MNNIKALIVMALLLAPAALAQKVVTATDATQVTRVLAANGYKFSLDSENDGTPLIRLQIGDGYKAILFFYDDDPGQPGYESLQLYAGFSVDGKIALATVNDWNYNYRFGKVYLDDELDPVIESDLDLSGGVALEGTLLVFIQNFEAAFDSFVEEVVGE
ncbi:YbjN domain-containing protein [Oceanithermus sp.]